jgi:hypothetical protein
MLHFILESLSQFIRALDFKVQRMPIDRTTIRNPAGWSNLTRPLPIFFLS